MVYSPRILALTPGRNTLVSVAPFTPVDSISVKASYRPQRSWGKVMFLHVSVILFTGGFCPIACWDTPLGPDPSQPGTPRADTPWEQTPHRVQCMLGDTGNKRVVRILLECNLVLKLNWVLDEYTSINA